jgi:hypothetical protein
MLLARVLHTPCSEKKDVKRLAMYSRIGTPCFSARFNSFMYVFASVSILIGARFVLLVAIT